MQLKHLKEKIKTRYMRLKYPIRKAVFFNPFQYIKNLIEEPKLTFKHYLSVCAEAKNEGIYFKEWLEYHMLIGVEKFYIYDNESNDNTREILEPYIKKGIVEYHFVPGRGHQRAVYKDCVRRHKYDTKWLAFIDLDEFFVPVETETIPEFLKKLSGNVSQLTIRWLPFGSSGHKTRPEGLVIENFQHRAKRPYELIGKSIVNPRRVLRSSVTHSIVLGRSVDENGDDLSGVYFINRPSYIDKIRVHHYGIKSWEEFSLRAGRGDSLRRNPNAGKKKYTQAYFKGADVRDVRDTIMDKWVTPVKEKLKVKN